MRKIALVGWVVWFGLSVVSCGGSGECINGIQTTDYNPSGLQCSKDCDCSNLKHEGYCVSGTCIVSERTTAQRKGEIRQCKLLQKVGSCEWGKQEAQPVPLKELLWGNCIPPVPTAENTRDTCGDSQDNDCDGLTDFDDPDCNKFCRPGDTKPCYNGPPNSQNIGECRGGTATCKQDYTWGPCDGEILPTTEVCDGKDNDCNRQVDEACGCTKDTDCPNEARCEAGSCKVLPCVSPNARCGKECIDVLTSAQHCGRCNRACTGGNACQDGECRCANGLIECTGVCVDTTQNNNHCGVCNNACGDRKTCQQKKCVCNQAFTDCSGDCANLSSDDKHCGTCGKSCKSYESCQSGSCVCKDPKGICGGVCVDIAVDNKHCGGCDQVCDLTKEQCTAGKCACLPSHTSCGDQCFDLQSSPQHCGGCGKSCGVGEACEGGRCVSLVSVSAGSGYTCAVTACGRLKCWGDGSQGRLGENAVTPRYLPNTAPLDFGTGQGQQIRQAATGDSHTCALLLDGSVYCWGKNDNGQLGYGHANRLLKPDPSHIGFPPGRVAKQLALGTTHTCARFDDQSVRCWGANDRGQLGYGDSTTRQAPPLAAIDVGTGRSTKWIGAGDAFTCALLDNDTVKCWGFNASGQLGYGDKTPRQAPPLNAVNLGAGRTAKAITVGAAHVCALLDNDTVKCWGANDRGQLGYGETTGRDAPDATAINVGTGRTVKAIATGFGRHTCAILDDNTLRCWGENSFGQLGNGESGTGKDQLAPPSTAIPLPVGRTPKAVTVGKTHTCAMLDNQDILCWGNGTSGELGDGNGVSQAIPPTEGITLGQIVCGGVCIEHYTSAHCGQCNTTCTGTEMCGVARCVPRVSDVVVGGVVNCTLQNNGEVRCWGRGIPATGYGDTQNRLQPDKVAVNLGAGRTAKTISTRGVSSCAILDDDTAKCWGTNTDGQLGYGDTATRSTPDLAPIHFGTGRTLKAIVPGFPHTCAILEDGSVRCWGKNEFGCLGYGNGTGRLAPPTEAVDLGTGRTAKALALANAATCAILDDNTLKCWGANASGRLGLGHTNHQLTPPATPINLGIGRTATAVSISGDHTCAILDNGGVKCWGAGADGRLGYGDQTPRLAPDLNPINLGAGRTAKAIATGTSHSCAILDDGTVKCWGYNNAGQLGYGDTMTRLAPDAQPVALGAGRTAKKIASTERTVCVLLDDETIKCWGQNNFGELGYGDFFNRLAPDAHPVRYR